MNCANLPLLTFNTKKHNGLMPHYRNFTAASFKFVKKVHTCADASGNDDVYVDIYVFLLTILTAKWQGNRRAINEKLLICLTYLAATIGLSSR